MGFQLVVTEKLEENISSNQAKVAYKSNISEDKKKPSFQHLGHLRIIILRMRNHGCPSNLI